MSTLIRIVLVLAAGSAGCGSDESPSNALDEAPRNDAGPADGGPSDGGADFGAPDAGPSDDTSDGSCERLSQCFAGNWCRAGECTGLIPCLEDLDCVDGGMCYRGECVVWNRCADGTECTGDQPCIDGHCLPDYCADCADSEYCAQAKPTDYCEPHAECLDVTFTDDTTGCQMSWEDCEGSDYQFSCTAGEDGWECICRSDVYLDVSLTTDPCREDGIHRVANWACEWQLPLPAVQP